MQPFELSRLYGARMLGPAQLRALSWPLPLSDMDGSEILFSDETLRRRSGTHLLIFTPMRDAQGTQIDLLHLRKLFGVNPDEREPCLYNQDWYLNEPFAKTPLDGNWHIIPLNALDEARARDPAAIESDLRQDERFPSAVTCTFAFFAWWFAARGERLWNHDFVWCRDRDHNGDRIYVGRYQDPTGVNRNGFNIHRHLALRDVYSAAPEVIGGS